MFIDITMFYSGKNMYQQVTMTYQTVPLTDFPISPHLLSTLSWSWLQWRHILFLFLLPRCCKNIATGATGQRLQRTSACSVLDTTKLPWEQFTAYIASPSPPPPSPIAAHHCCLWCCKGSVSMDQTRDIVLRSEQTVQCGTTFLILH